jgi:hypothetical protein
MRHFIDTVLLDKKKIFIARTIALVVVIVSSLIIVHAYLSFSNLNRRAELLSHFFSLQDSITLLKTEVNDSLVNQTMKRINDDVLKGWDSAAVLIEIIRSEAVKNKIVMSYEISPLVMYPQCGEHYKRILFRISAVPGDRKFETVMKFIQAISTVMTIQTSLEHIEFTGDDNGLYQANLSIAGWIIL